jgi:hypothetical protein
MVWGLSRARHETYSGPFPARPEQRTGHLADSEHHISGAPYVEAARHCHRVRDARNSAFRQKQLQGGKSHLRAHARSQFRPRGCLGGHHDQIFTNSLGFKDARVREVPLRSDRKRVLFMGDSFTEALGVAYEESFVGRFAAAFPQLEVLNGGVSGYAPSVYYAKTKYLIEMGLQTDEVIVYIDISDIQEEATTYRTGKDGKPS